MRKGEISYAVNHIDESIMEEVIVEKLHLQKKKSRAKTIRWTALIAALLAVAVLIPVGVVFANKAPEETPAAVTETPKKTETETTETPKEETPAETTETPVEPTETQDPTVTPVETETPYVAPTGINANSDTITEKDKYLLKSNDIWLQSEVAPVAIIRVTEVAVESWKQDVSYDKKTYYAKVGFEVLYSQGEVCTTHMNSQEERHLSEQMMPLGEVLNAVSYIDIPLRDYVRTTKCDYQYEDKVEVGAVFLCDFRYHRPQYGYFYDDGTFDSGIRFKARRALIFDDGKLVRDMNNHCHQNFYDGNIERICKWIDDVLLSEKYKAFKEYWYKDLIEKEPCKKLENGMTVEQVIELFDWYKEFSKIYNDYDKQVFDLFGRSWDCITSLDELDALYGENNA